MTRFWPWLKKYFTVVLAFGLVIAAVLMTVDWHALFPVSEVVKEGDGTNQTISTQEEFETLMENTVEPLLARTWGEQSLDNLPAPKFQGLTMILKEKFDETFSNGIGKCQGQAIHELSVRDGAIYLNVQEDASDGFDEGHDLKIEYYITKTDTYARISRFNLFDADEGGEITEQQWRQITPSRSEDSFLFNEGFMQMAFGSLLGKWVRVTGTILADQAKYEIESACHRAKKTLRYGTFTPGEEPIIVREYSYTFDNGYTGRATLVEELVPNAPQIYIDSVQFKYINNTVIKDITSKKIYDINDYQ